MIDYRNIVDHCLDGLEEQLKGTPQDPKFHGEGDVLIHTKLVYDCLDLSGLSEHQEAILKISALLHDIGKIRTTVIEGSDIVCPNHSVVGARMARSILWKKFGLVGTQEAIEFREAIIGLVRYHSFPPHILEDENSLAKTYRIASLKFLTSDFSLDLLYRLGKADMEGRVCEDKENVVSEVECFKDLAIEEGILDSTGILGRDKYSDNRFLNFKTGDSKEPSLYDNTWGEIILMCGLPGTGKDTYIGNNYEIPVISLDSIRKELKLKPGSSDGKIIQTAKERAKEYLRKKQSFVWNATNLTRQRSQLIELFETYGARTKIVYLETTQDERNKRNHSREDIVPVDVIDGMIEKLVLPEYWEAQNVEWKIV